MTENREELIRLRRWLVREAGATIIMGVVGITTADATRGSD
jgi:hypothetical protein